MKQPGELYIFPTARAYRYLDMLERQQHPWRWRWRRFIRWLRKVFGLKEDK